MNILNKYKNIMFRDRVFGLPPLSIGANISSAMASIRSGIRTGANAAKDGMMAAGRAGANALKNAYGGVGAAGAGLANMGMDQFNNLTGVGMPNMAQLQGIGMPGMGGIGGMQGMPEMPGMPGIPSINPDKMLFGDMFKQFDKDRSGYIDYNEFCEMCKYMGLFLDKEKSLKLFSMADRSNNNQIELSEFKYAMALLKLQIAYETLKKLGLTLEDLVWYGILAMIFLLLLFVFIFLGISAFSRAEGFNAVVNSCLPLTAGAAMAARKIDIKGALEKVKGFVQNIIMKLKKKA
jgi:hypothetical protein